MLSGIQNSSEDVFFKGTEAINFSFTNTQHIETDKLVSALSVVLSRIEDKKPPTRENFKGIVHREKISLTDKIKEVQKKIRLQKRVSFVNVFEGVTSKYEAITVFLAVLHLISSSKVSMREKGKEIILSSNGDTIDK